MSPSSQSHSHSHSPPSRSPTATKTTDHSNSVRISTLRLSSDLRALERDSVEGVDAAPLDSANIYVWRACIFGPPDTAWEGGVFELTLSFPIEYPQKPPAVRFTSKIYHPNVFADGNLCLDIIADAWSPIYTVSTILTSIQSLLTDPNPASPANPEAAQLYQTNKKEYNKKVRAAIARMMGT